MKGKSLFLSLASLLVLCGCDSSISSSVAPIEEELTLEGYCSSIYEGRSLALLANKEGVSFSSSDPSVASVSSSGVVTSLKEGNVTITAKDSSNNEAHFDLEVKPLPDTLSGIFSLAKEHNYTLSYATSTFRYIDLYNLEREDAKDQSISGVLQNGMQGLVSFHEEDSSIELDSFFGLGKVKTVNDIYGDLLTPFISSTSIWERTNLFAETGFATTDETLISSFLDVLGLSSYASYVSQVSLDIDYAKSSLMYTTSISGQLVGFQVESIGITSSSILERYLVHPVDAKKRNDWSDKDKDTLESMFPEISIPYPSSSSYATAVVTSSSSFSFSDYASLDICEQYKDALISSNWKFDSKEDSHMGYDEYRFSYAVRENGELDSYLGYEATMHYIESDLLDEKEKKAFPNGKFEVTFNVREDIYSSSSSNEDILNKYLSSKAKGKFPSLNLDKKASKVVVEDVKKENNERIQMGILAGVNTEDDLYEFALFAEAYITSLDDALSIESSYASILKENGFSYSSSYSTREDHYEVYLKDDLEVIIHPSYENGEYKGKLNFFFGY